MIFTALPLSPIPDLSIPEFLESNPYHNEADQVVYIDSDTDERITWGGYLNYAKWLSSGLRSAYFSDASLSYGDLVLILSPNMPNYPMTYIGIMGAGYVPSPVSPAATAPELAAILRLAQSKAIIVHPTLQSLLSEAVKLAGSDSPRLSWILMTPEAGSQLPTVSGAVRAGKTAVQPFEKLRRPAGESLALVPYSSGTTGPFKGVMLSHRNIIANVIQLRQGWGDYWEPRPMSLSFLADYHSYSHTQVCIVNPISGMPTVRMPKYDLEKMLVAIERYKVVAIPMVPPTAVSLAKNPITEKYDLSSIKRIMISAAPTKPEIVRVLREKFGATVLQTFGCTEVSPTSHALPAHLGHWDGSVGKLLPGMECRLVKEDGADAGFDEEGEFFYKGPNVMMGYYRNPEATKSTFSEDGWFKSGDVGKCNKDGLFWVTDRIKEMIKVKGFQVSPADLEAVLLGHPRVLDAAVKRGIAESTELPVAFLVVAPKDETEAFKAEIKSYVAERVSHYKKVSTVVFVESVPKNPSGKILRRLLPTLDLTGSSTTTLLSAKL